MNRAFVNTNTSARISLRYEGMAQAIRLKDKTHSIIFGDVSRDDITPLSQRTPFTDPNVIYAFHFYELLVFTNQGLFSTGMPATNNVPYPYSPDKWSERY